MKAAKLLTLISLSFLFSFSQISSSTFPRKQKLIDSLLKEMTLEEKIGQMTLFTSDWDKTGPT